MPLREGETGEILEVPADSGAIQDAAMATLKAHGYGVREVCRVYPASNSIYPGYEVVFYIGQTTAERTGLMWYEKGKLKIETFDGWIKD